VLDKSDYRQVQFAVPLLPVIDRPEKIRPQQFGELPGIDAVTLAAFFQQSIPAGIAHHGSL
jgi:hypothetical protein